MVPSVKEAVVIWLQALEGTGLRCTGPHVRETTRGHSKGVQRRCVNAKLVTLAMVQAMLGFTSEARWLRHARAHLRHLFSYLPEQPGYNLACQVAGSTGEFTAVFLGRARITGIEPGTRIRLEGKVAIGADGSPRMINPAYELLP